MIAMTFDNGANTHTSTQSEITESLIRLLAQIALSIGVVGTYLIMLVQSNPNAASLQPVVLGVIAFWLGQSAISGWAGVQQSKIKAGVK